MISLHQNSSFARLLVFLGAVTAIGMAACDSPLAPPALQSASKTSPSADFGGWNQGSTNNCADNDDRDDRAGNGGCSSGQLVSNVSSFNRSSISAGSTIWFSAVVQVSGVPKNGATLTASGQTIQFTANGQSYNVAVPNGTITFSSSATVSSTVFNAATNSWATTVPMNNHGHAGDWDDSDDNGSSAGSIFLTAVAFPVAVTLPAGISPVTWNATFSSSMSGLRVQWKWAAAVYKQFGTDYNSLGVKAVDDNHSCAFRNSDNAGTPENEKSFIKSGATGNGGSNYTGSYSDAVCPYVSTGSAPVAGFAVAILQNLAQGTAPATGTATSVSVGSGATGPFTVSLQNNSASALSPIGCTATITATGAGLPYTVTGAVGSTSVAGSGGQTTCTFSATSPLTAASYSVVVTAVLPAGDVNSSSPQTFTVNVVAGAKADVVVSAPTRVQKTGAGVLSLLDLLVNANDTTKLGATDTLQALVKNTGAVATTVTCVAVDTAGTGGLAPGVLTLLSGAGLCGSGSTTIQPGATDTIRFTLTIPSSDPNNITVSATPTAGAPADPNLANNVVKVSIAAQVSGTFTDIADASLTSGQIWTVGSNGALTDRNEQVVDLQRLSMLVTQQQDTLGTFTLSGSVVNSHGDVLSSVTTGLDTLLASVGSGQPLGCVQTAAPYAANFAQVTLSICSQQVNLTDSASYQRVVVEYNHAQQSGPDVTNPSALLYALPAAAQAIGYDSVTVNMTLNFTIHGAGHADYATAQVITFVTTPAATFLTTGTGNTPIYLPGTYQSGPAKGVVHPNLLCTGAPLVCITQQ